MTTGRIQRAASLGDRLIGLAVLPATTVAAARVRRLMWLHPDVGDVLFTAGMFASV